MGRDYRKVLRERGIPTQSETRPFLTALRHAWQACPDVRRREFLEWAGLCYDPDAKPPRDDPEPFHAA